MNYYYEKKDDNNKILVIAFQSAGRIPPDIMDLILESGISQDEVDKYHKKYNWMKLSRKMKNADFLYVEDNYSSMYGWYCFDNEKFIYDKLNSELTEFLKDKNYEKVIAFGSSKGGTASILYGILNPYITHCFALVPQIDVVKHIKEYMTKYEQVFFPNTDNNEKFLSDLSNLFYNVREINGLGKAQIYIYTGIKDAQFKELRDFFNKRDKNINLIVNISEKRHTKLVTENGSFIEDMLKAIANKKRCSDPRLINLGGKTFILDDKSL